jgi:hypothetical protein
MLLLWIKLNRPKLGKELLDQGKRSRLKAAVLNQELKGDLLRLLTQVKEQFAPEKTINLL